MDIYLDQNKWIDLAKIYHGKDERDESKELLELILNSIDSDKVRFPLSSIHYVETASISNAGRKERLGVTMFDLSKGTTLAPYRQIVIHELENALSRYFNFSPSKFELFGYGCEHAFGVTFPSGISPKFRPLIERSCLTGEEVLGHRMAGFVPKEHNFKFQNHLQELHQIKKQLPKSTWDDSLYALALSDILGPLNEVLNRWNIKFDEVTALGKETLSKVLDSMPSRALEIHLHKLVLANPDYKPKLTDLDDWGGFALGSQYYDYAVGEKHMVDMLTRQGFLPKTKVDRSIYALRNILEST